MRSTAKVPAAPRQEQRQVHPTRLANSIFYLLQKWPGMNGSNNISVRKISMLAMPADHMSFESKLPVPASSCPAQQKLSTAEIFWKRNQLHESRTVVLRLSFAKARQRTET